MGGLHVLLVGDLSMYGSLHGDCVGESFMETEVVFGATRVDQDLRGGA